MTKRALITAVKGKMFKKKVIIIMGARCVGKGHLVRTLLKELRVSHFLMDGDLPRDLVFWSNPDWTKILVQMEPFEVIVLRDVQNITNIFTTIKKVMEHFPEKQFILTSASNIKENYLVHLKRKVIDFQLFPLTWKELVKAYSFAKANEMLESILVFGCYPEVILSQDKKSTLSYLVGNHLYIDILSSGNVRKPVTLYKLLQTLALQVGKEISYNAIAKTTGLDKETVSYYIDLLEKNYVIFKLHPLAKNANREISATRKIYFYDNGILNALIDNYDPTGLRKDIELLWENFIISEKIKYNLHTKNNRKSWFWRNKAQAKIDYIEEKSGQYYVYDIYWDPQKKSKFSISFIDFYQPKAEITIHKENFWEIFQ